MIEMRTTSIDRQPSPPPCRDQLRRRQPELLGGLLDRIAFVGSFDFAEQQSSVDASVTDSPSRQAALAAAARAAWRGASACQGS